MSLGFLEIMLPAFAECLVLVGIHSYLGIHVIKRKVIFVDLALAQIAALGITVAFLFGVDPSSQGAYWFSFGFTIIGAAIFAISRLRHDKIPQEAVIGLVYALAAAVAVLVIDRAPHGAEHIKEIMTGNILWVRWETILLAAGVYALVGLFHFLFREKFLLISNHPEQAFQSGLNVRFWDFLFYISFGIVITHSVNTAGVLLVFVFLVAPAMATILLTDKLWLQLALGWTMGTIVSGAGLIVSYVGDLPSGPAVAATYGLVLVLVALVLYVIRSSNRMLALRNIGLGIVFLLLAYGGFYAMGQYFTRDLHRDEGSDVHETHNAAGAETTNIPGDFQARLTAADTGEEFAVLLRDTADPFQRLDVLKRWVDVHPAEGLRRIIIFLESDAVPFIREEAVGILHQYTDRRFGYDSTKPPEQNEEAIRQMYQWWEREFR